MNEFSTHETKFLGRNGLGRCLGFTLLKRHGCVAIYPRTSKGIDARCFIEVDDRDINTFIRNLRDEMLFGLIAARKSDGFGSGKSYSIVHNPAVDKVTDKEVFQDEIL